MEKPDGSAAPDPSALERPWAGHEAAAGLSEAEHATIEENLKLASGGAAPSLAWQTLRELAAAAGPCNSAGAPDEAGAARVFAAVEAAAALAPRDPLEGMLAAQMAAVHAAALRCLVRAAECAAWPQIEARYLRTAVRLLNLFVRQADTLDRRARQFPQDQSSCHAPPSAGMAPGARHRIADPMPAAARGPGADGGDSADDGASEPDGAAILERVIADATARMRAREKAEAGEGDGEPDGASGDGGRDRGDGGTGAGTAQGAPGSGLRGGGGGSNLRFRGEPPGRARPARRARRKS